MAAGSIAAGLVNGYVRGMGLRREMDREDEERKAREEERAYIREQRGRVRKQQADEDAVADALKGVQRTTPADGWGEGYDWARQNQAATRDDEGSMMPGVATIQAPRSQRDILADQARAIAGIGGLRGAQLGLQFQQGVDQLDQIRVDRERQQRLDARQAESDRQAGIDREARRAREAIEDRQRRVLEGLRNSRLLLSGAGNDPARLESVAKQMQGIYEGVPDGRQLVIGNGMMGVATPDGKYVFPPVPINRQNMESALDYAERYLDPNWAARRKVDDDRSYRDSALGLQRDELEAQIRGGYFTKAPPAFTPIGLSDDGRRILGRQGDRVVEVPVPAGYSGLLPKVTGERPRPTKFLKGEDGTQTAVDDKGKPLFNQLDGGLEAPLGVTNSSWRRMQQEASKAGVRAALGKDASGAPVVAYIGRDGNAYSTVQEAAAAK